MSTQSRRGREALVSDSRCGGARRRCLRARIPYQALYRRHKVKDRYRFCQHAVALCCASRQADAEATDYQSSGAAPYRMIGEVDAVPIRQPPIGDDYPIGLSCQKLPRLGGVAGHIDRIAGAPQAHRQQLTLFRFVLDEQDTFFWQLRASPSLDLIQEYRLGGLSLLCMPAPQQGAGYTSARPPTQREGQGATLSGVAIPRPQLR